MDELSGFIAACALVRPTGIEGMKPKSVKKKLKQPSFAAAVDRDQERHVKTAARQYMHQARQEKALYRFDIVSVEMSPEQSGPPQITHLRDAFR